MRILYLLQQFPKKTSETFILNEMIELQKMGHDVWVLADWINHQAIINTHALVAENNFMEKVIEVDSYSRGFFKLLDFLRKSCLAIIHSPKKYFFGFEMAFFSKAMLKNFNFWIALDNYLLFHKISNLKFDLIYSPFAPIEKIKRGRVIADYNEAPFVSAFRALELYGEKYEKNIRKFKDIYDLVDGLITISEYNKRYLLEEIGFKQNIYVVHSSIDPSRFISSLTKMNNETVKIITIARFVEKKGIEYLLRALSDLKKTGFNFEYTLIGDGPLKLVIETNVKDLGLSSCVNIIEPINQESIKEILNTSDIFILPCIIAENGDRDILANVLKEAMSMELPVITSNISGIDELINDGVNGVLVPQKDSDALKNAIIKLAGDKELCRKLGASGRKKIIENFNVKYEALKLEQVFQGVKADKPL